MVDGLFVPVEISDNIYEFGIPGSNGSAVNYYPQAGLRSVGHFQAMSIPTVFYPHIEELNKELRNTTPETPCYPIRGVSCQGYNALMHSTRGYGAQHHEVQQALITATLTGTIAKGADSIAKYRKLHRELSFALPHERFNAKINNRTISRDLRCENVYTINFLALSPENRTGE